VASVLEQSNTSEDHTSAEHLNYEMSASQAASMESNSPSPRSVEIDDLPHDFESMGISQISLDAVRAAGFTRPSPIQAALIPHALQGIDCIGQARTGTGKTAAFLLPLFERLRPHKAGEIPQAIILIPTRELATQVELECEKLAVGRKIRTVVLSGGKPIRKQISLLESGVEIVIGTPGRVIDHINRGTLVLSGVHYVVLDEADRMLDIGFRPDIEKILRKVPTKRQTLLLSATVPGPVERLAQRYMDNPVMVNRSPADISADTIDQYYITVDKFRKFEALVALLELECPDQAIVFCRTKRGTDKVTKNLMNVFEEISSIHGDMAQNVRDRVMQRFRSVKIRVLVATDVMGRGIDVSGISHIINYDIPEFCDDYVHRVGRTGRAGRFGVAFTLVSPEEGPQLTSIEMRINKLLERVHLEGFADLDKPQGAPTERSAEAMGVEVEKPAEGPGGKGRGRRHRKAL